VVRVNDFLDVVPGFSIPMRSKIIGPGAY